MSEMIRRNCRIYLRDRSAVFFSLLSMFILLALMIGFLGRNNIDSILKMLETYGGTRNASADEANAVCYVQYWVLAGILCVNSLTVSISVTGVMVSDRASHRSRLFASTPVSGAVLSFSYIITSILVSFGMCLLTLLAGIACITLSGGEMLSFIQILQSAGLIFLNSVLASTGAYICALMAKTASAWAGLSTIIGTLIGFLGGIYVPVGALPESIGNFIRALPFLQSASLMRQVLGRNALQEMSAGLPAEVIRVFNEEMGNAIVFADTTLHFPFQLWILAGYGIMFIIIALLMGKHMKTAER
jgi:multidrug/hemolysin transport system permease protein